jgi:hypothetical protein
MHLFAAPRLSLSLRRDLHARFEQFANRTAGVDARVMLSLRAEMWGELKTAVNEERAQRAARHPNQFKNLPASLAPRSSGVPTGDKVAAGTSKAQHSVLSA